MASRLQQLTMVTRLTTSETIALAFGPAVVRWRGIAVAVLRRGLLAVRRTVGLVRVFAEGLFVAHVTSL